MQGQFAMTGVYCAVSMDVRSDRLTCVLSFDSDSTLCCASAQDGDSWETRRPITTDLTAAGHNQTGFDGRDFMMSYNTTEPNGYMAAAVSDDGVITLITSRNSYSFNLAWLRTKAPPAM